MAKEQGYGVSGRLIEILEAARPEHPDKPGQPISDNKWCEIAGVSTGFWRDLRKGSTPRIDNVERMARAINLTLTDLLEGREPPVLTLPTSEEIGTMIANAQAEMQTSVSYGDWPRAVAAGVRERLVQFLGLRQDGLDGESERLTSPGRSSRSQKTTKPDARG